MCCLYITSGANISVYENLLESLDSYDELVNMENLFLVGDFNIPEINGSMYEFQAGSTRAKIINQILSKYDLHSIKNISNFMGITLDLVLTNLTEAKVTACDTPLVPVDRYHPPIEINLNLTNINILMK